MFDTARGQPFLLRTHRLRQAQGDRQRRRLFEREAEPENTARRHVGDERQVGPADERPAALDNLDEIDVGRRVIDLADIQRVRRVDVSRPGLEPMEMFRVRRSLLCDFLGPKQCWYSASDREVGRRSQARLLAAGADLGHDRSEGRSLQHQPLLSQCRRDDLLDVLLKSLLPCPIPAGQERRHGPIDTVACEQIVDLPRRKAQFGCGPNDRRPSGTRAVQNPVEFARNAAHRRPCFFGM